jgi:hypothetical protein
MAGRRDRGSRPDDRHRRARGRGRARLAAHPWSPSAVPPALATNKGRDDQPRLRRLPRRVAVVGRCRLTVHAVRRMRGVAPGGTCAASPLLPPRAAPFRGQDRCAIRRPARSDPRLRPVDSNDARQGRRAPSVLGLQPTRSPSRGRCGALPRGRQQLGPHRRELRRGLHASRLLTARTHGVALPAPRSPILVGRGGRFPLSIKVHADHRLRAVWTAFEGLRDITIEIADAIQPPIEHTPSTDEEPAQEQAG